MRRMNPEEPQKASDTSNRDQDQVPGRIGSAEAAGTKWRKPNPEPEARKNDEVRMTNSDFVIRTCFGFLVSSSSSILDHAAHASTASRSPAHLWPLGCTHYEYDITRPADLGDAHRFEDDAVAPRQPLEIGFWGWLKTGWS